MSRTRWFVDRRAQSGIPSVSLRRLLPDAQFEGCRDLEVSSCTADSRRLGPGQLFVALKARRGSENADGHAFVRSAIEQGAAGVLVEQHCPEGGPLQVVVPDTHAAYARLCQAMAGHPSECLQTLGIAGGVGRSAVSLFLREILRGSKSRYGWIGNTGWSDGRDSYPSAFGDSGAEGLASTLAELVDRGCAGALIELGPEALEDRTVEGVTLDAAVATGFGTWPPNARGNARRQRNQVARLFRQIVPGGAAIVNADDPEAEVLGAVNLLARRVSFGIDNQADIQAKSIQWEPNRSRFVLSGFDREATVDLRMGGKPAVRQALAAAATAWSQGIDVDSVVAGLEAVSGIPGQLDVVDEGNGQSFAVRVDEAKSAAELADAIEAVRSFTTGRIHVVFGAEGLRDRLERLLIAGTVEALADRLTLTNDNPRTEDPDQIVDDLLAGLRTPGRVRVEPNRKTAIESTLADALPGDCVLIAGKGRQAVQIFADHCVPFDDAETAGNWLRARHDSQWITA